MGSEGGCEAYAGTTHHGAGNGSDLLKVDGALPLDSAGEPPGEGSVYEERKRVLREAGEALGENFKERVREKGQARIRTANRWHMGATWLFTGCPSGVVDILMEAVCNPPGYRRNTAELE